MYLQALICSVGLKYYKHFKFSDSGDLLFKVAIFARFTSMYPVCSSTVLWTDASLLECITWASHEAYVHVNAELAEAEGNTLWLSGDNL